MANAKPDQSRRRNESLKKHKPEIWNLKYENEKKKNLLMQISFDKHFPSHLSLNAGLSIIKKFMGKSAGKIFGLKFINVSYFLS